MFRFLHRSLLAIYRSNWAAVAIAAVLGAIGVANHSMWRDEMNVWLVVRDSPTFAALLENIRYDRAHPGLWHLSVALLQQLSDRPMAMQVFHGLLAMGAIFLLWKYSPFGHLQKWLISFGYLPFYEHLLIARNYGLGMLLLFAICAAWPLRNRALWPLAGLLVLLANANIYAFWIAIALTLTLAWELFRTPPRLGFDLLGSSLLVLVGYGIAAYFIAPPPGVASQALGQSFFDLDGWRLLATLGRLFASYTLIIPNGDRWLDLAVCGAIALAAMVAISLALVRKPYALAFYLTANAIVLSFTYVKHLSDFFRHFGNLYLILIAALWLSRHYPVSTRLQVMPLSWLARARRRSRQAVLVFFVAHFLGGVYGYLSDLLIPYSASKVTAAYIREHGLDRAFIVASRDAQMAPLSGYLNRQFYYPERQDLGSYTLFFKGERQTVSQAEVLQQTSELLADRAEILLILSEELATSQAGLTVVPIAEFTKTWQNEAYYLYWVCEQSEPAV